MSTGFNLLIILFKYSLVLFISYVFDLSSTERCIKKTSTMIVILSIFLLLLFIFVLYIEDIAAKNFRVVTFS